MNPASLILISFLSLHWRSVPFIHSVFVHPDTSGEKNVSKMMFSTLEDLTGNPIFTIREFTRPTGRAGELTPGLLFKTLHNLELIITHQAKTIIEREDEFILLRLADNMVGVVVKIETKF